MVKNIFAEGKKTFLEIIMHLKDFRADGIFNISFNTQIPPLKHSNFSSPKALFLIPHSKDLKDFNNFMEEQLIVQVLKAILSFIKFFLGDC